MPADARYIGTEERIVQNIKIHRENIKFSFKRYYSKSLKKTFIGDIEGYDGSKFGADLRAFIDYLHFKLRVPHEKIREFLSEFEIDISKGKLSDLLSGRKPEFKEELKGARDASLRRCKSNHLDETGHKLNNLALYTFCFSNEYMTSMTTFSRKTKADAMASMFLGYEKYCFNQVAMNRLLKERKSLLKKTRFLFSEKVYSKSGFDKVLVAYNFTKEEQTKIRSCAIYGAYIKQGIGPPIKYLVTDDAKNLVFWKRHQLCWVHEIRKYKLLDLYGHSEIVDEVIAKWFKFYRLLKSYKRGPSRKNKGILWRVFNKLCKEDTGLTKLNEQLQRTFNNRKKLLYVLNQPEVEIHNNLVERDIREKVIKKKISLFNRSMDGVKSWDLMLSLASTCRKNKISFYKYLVDRYNEKGEIKYLGQIIANR